MKFYIVLALLIIGLCARAQNKDFQVVDRFCKCPEFIWNGNFFQLHDIRKSTSDLEIRFTYTAVNSFKSVLVLKKKNDKYHAAYYARQMRLPPQSSGDSIKKYGKWEQYPHYKFAVDSSNLNQIVQKFIDHHILTLPKQRKVLDQPYTAYYFVEYKDREKIRSYTFGAPIDPEPKEYPDIEELQEYAQLSELFHSVVEKQNIIFQDYISHLPHDLIDFQQE